MKGEFARLAAIVLKQFYYFCNSFLLCIHGNIKQIRSFAYGRKMVPVLDGTGFFQFGS